MGESALEIAGLAVKALQDQPIFERLRSLLKTRYTVLVTGCSGAGKTNLLLSLQKLLPEAIDLLDRTRVVKSNPLSIAGQVFNFLDTPGEVAFGEQRIRAIRTALREKHTLCILNVVSFGYLENREGQQSAFDRSGHLRSEFLAQGRQKELLLLEELIPALMAAGRSRRPKMITVVTKADLWWGDRERVLSYYRSGDYYRALGPIQKCQSAVTGYSSVRKKFYGIGAVDTSFDQHDTVKLRANLLTLMLSMTDERD